jgi:hypothetical protein
LPCGIETLLIEKYGWARPAAEAVQNILDHRESSCNPRAFNPTSCRGGPCTGLAQWDRQRWRAHLAMCSRIGLDPYSVEAQVNTLVREWITYWPHAAQRIQCETTSQATATFDHYFLRGNPDR